MLQEIDRHRRHFFRVAAGTLAAGIGATDARDGIREGDTGARAGNGVFDGVDDEGIAQTDNEHDHQRTKSGTGIAKKNGRKRGENGERDKKLHDTIATAQDGHQPVEERIAQRMVDKIEQARIERLQPMHWQDDSGKPGIGKLNCLECFKELRAFPLSHPSP